MCNKIEFLKTHIFTWEMDTFIEPKDGICIALILNISVCITKGKEYYYLKWLIKFHNGHNKILSQLLTKIHIIFFSILNTRFEFSGGT